MEGESTYEIAILRCLMLLENKGLYRVFEGRWAFHNRTDNVNEFVNSFAMLPGTPGYTGFKLKRAIGKLNEPNSIAVLQGEMSKCNNHAIACSHDKRGGIHVLKQADNVNIIFNGRKVLFQILGVFMPVTM